MSLDAANRVICDLAIELISEGKVLREIASYLGMKRRTLHDWLQADPQTAAKFARAREIGYDAIAEDLLLMTRNKDLDARDRRVQFDAGLKLLSRWAPERYGETLTLKQDDDGERQERSELEIAQRLALMLQRPVPLQIEHVVDAEFTDAS